MNQGLDVNKVSVCVVFGERQGVSPPTLKYRQAEAVVGFARQQEQLSRLIRREYQTDRMLCHPGCQESGRKDLQPWLADWQIRGGSMKTPLRRLPWTTIFTIWKCRLQTS
ncbi:MAG: hypothetical protein U0936_27015 [Planctomycetaceae bacterium]